MQKRQSLTAEDLKRQLHYSPETGVFTWLRVNSNRVKIGAAAGALQNGYVRIRIAQVAYAAHRLAWLYVYGAWPSADIDHINMDKVDNRLRNLRMATRSQNFMNKKVQSNNLSGFKGVSYVPTKRKYKARCKFEGKQHHLGYFPSPELASAAYHAFAKQFHGEFYNSTGV